MATVQALQRHRQGCLRHGVTAILGGLLLAVVPLSDFVVGSGAAVSTAVATVAALAGLAGTVALAGWYRGATGGVGALGVAILALGFACLAVGGATGSLDLLGRLRPGGGLPAVFGYFLLLVGALPFGLSLWRSGGSLGAAALFILAMPVGYVTSLGLERLALPAVTTAFFGFGLPVAAGLVGGGVSILLEPSSACERGHR